ncbi:MAG TPA: 50S ribosomal protein L24 [Actinomycetota bacterium]|nr:50S ribosomal protein L24 [Actinomycetota bacterium]
MPGVDIKRDDTVRVMAGKSRGHTGRVIRVLPREGRVMVEGAAMAKKHQRASGRRSTSGQQLQQGGIIDTELFIDISNVQIVCKSCGRPTRVGHRLQEDGRKVRVCRKCGADL